MSLDKYLDAVTEAELAEFRLPCFLSQIFRDLVSSEQTANAIFNVELLNELTALIKHIINLKTVTPVDEVCFLSVAIMLSDIASTDQGKKFILQGFNQNQSDNFKCELLESIASFVNKELQEKTTKFSSQVIGSAIFFLRQFYRTWEGLLYMKRFSLHESLAKRRFDSRNYTYNEKFDLMLIDNLLNFGATPQGVVLLHSSGSMVPCVSYMLARYQLF